VSVGQIGKVALKGFGLLVAISFAVTLFSHGNDDPNNKPSQDAARSTALDEQALDYVAVEQAKKGILSILKDADSAKFRDVTVAQWIEKNPAVCGYVNSKNSFGAYTGYTEFAVFHGLASINDHNHKEFVRLRNTLCVPNPNSSEKPKPTPKPTNR
jgi:hypothetical protein